MIGRRRSSSFRWRWRGSGQQRLQSTSIRGDRENSVLWDRNHGGKRRDGELADGFCAALNQQIIFGGHIRRHRPYDFSAPSVNIVFCDGGDLVGGRFIEELCFRW